MNCPDCDQLMHSKKCNHCGFERKLTDSEIKEQAYKLKSPVRNKCDHMNCKFTAFHINGNGYNVCCAHLTDFYMENDLAIEFSRKRNKIILEKGGIEQDFFQIRRKNIQNGHNDFGGIENK